MLYENLLKFFESGWFVAQNDEETFLRLLYEGKNGGMWVCYAQAVEKEHLLIFYSVLQNPVEEALRLPMAELLSRINYGLKIGNFEIDLADGEVRYKTSVMLENDAWSDDVI